MKAVRLFSSEVVGGGVGRGDEKCVCHCISG